jgi:hypothetical protein
MTEQLVSSGIASFPQQHLALRGKRRPESWAEVGVYVVRADFATVEPTLEFHGVFDDTFRSLQEGLDEVSEAKALELPPP